MTGSDSEADPGPQSEPEPGPEPDRRTIAPFLGALAIIVLVLAAILLLNSLGDNAPTPAQEVARAAIAENDALQRANYQDFRLYTCGARQGKEADVLARQRDSVAKHGERFVDDVTGVRIDGDRASATVTYHFDKTPEASVRSDLSFTREDGAWKVCSPGPS